MLFLEVRISCMTIMWNWFIAAKETGSLGCCKNAGVTASFRFGVSIVKPQNVSSTPAKSSLVRLFLQKCSQNSSLQNEFCGDPGFIPISLSIQGLGKACVIISSALRSRQRVPCSAG